MHARCPFFRFPLESDYYSPVELHSIHGVLRSSHLELCSPFIFRNGLCRILAAALIALCIPNPPPSPLYAYFPLSLPLLALSVLALVLMSTCMPSLPPFLFYPLDLVGARVCDGGGRVVMCSL